MTKKFYYIALSLIFPISGFADETLLSLDLEQLMEMNVTSVSKREQPLSSAAAAIYTISNSDIRRSGATTLPEILHQAPGVEVARISNSTWAVTARGFSSQFANKLLILVDGRSVYTTLFSGIYWDTLLPPLEEIQRIEIIRGPGASLWGSNAVNGIINIITYDSELTQGERLTLGAGNEEKGYLRTRYGFRSDNLTGRVNAQYRSVDDFQHFSDKQPAGDDYDTSQAGFRFDWRPTVDDKVTIDGGATTAHKQFTLNVGNALRPYVAPDDEINAKTVWLMGNWLHRLHNDDAVFFQTYIHHDNRNDALYDAVIQAVDLELQYNHREINNHRVTWGVDHRENVDEVDGSFILDFHEKNQRYSQSTLFMQDEYAFDETLLATVGIKFEDGELADQEYQPSVRLAWNPHSDFTWWWAISRATRIPSRSEVAMVLRVPLPGYLNPLLTDPTPFYIGEVNGSEHFGSESVYAYETGARLQATPKLFIDIATYINEYRDMRSYETIPVPAGDKADFAFEYANGSLGRSEGVELAADYKPTAVWRLKCAYSYFNFDSRSNESIVNQNAQPFEFTSPQNQAYLTSYHELGDRWQYDWTLKHVDELYKGFIPEYTDVDMRLAWHANPQLTVSVLGRDLFDSARLEYVDTNYGPVYTEIQRSIYLQVEWR